MRITGAASGVGAVHAGSIFVRIGPWAVGLAGFVLLSTACTRGSGPDVAQLSSTPSARSSPGSTLAFARCMRMHGVPNFPDSEVFEPGMGIDPNSPQFMAAQKTCQSLEPPGQGEGQQSAASREALLKFSACVRNHGLPGFPDPSSDSSRLTGPVNTIFGIVIPSGIDPHSPVFQAALKACRSVLSGGGPPEPAKVAGSTP